jgi:hypothetical protein
MRLCLRVRSHLCFVSHSCSHSHLRLCLHRHYYFVSVVGVVVDTLHGNILILSAIGSAWLYRYVWLGFPILS